MRRSYHSEETTISTLVLPRPGVVLDCGPGGRWHPILQWHVRKRLLATRLDNQHLLPGAANRARPPLVPVEVLDVVDVACLLARNLGGGREVGGLRLIQRLSAQTWPAGSAPGWQATEHSSRQRK